MAIRVENEDQEKTFVVVVEGRLDHHASEAFFRALERAEETAESYVVDFSACPYLDSAGLGMILLMRDLVDPSIGIALRGCRPEVRRILEIARLQETFPID
ncbi:MAG: STAS domain-containing protein [Spirochaetaceae bacterium]|nr:STAS domain-containing protein [Myxococcales bacterium]MCB9726452.1 STAS domain-containing protein [Spirochaetaceae bacterium]